MTNLADELFRQTAAMNRALAANADQQRIHKLEVALRDLLCALQEHDDGGPWDAIEVAMHDAGAVLGLNDVAQS